MGKGIWTAATLPPISLPFIYIGLKESRQVLKTLSERWVLGFLVVLGPWGDMSFLAAFALGSGSDLMYRQHVTQIISLLEQLTMHLRDGKHEIVNSGDSRSCGVEVGLDVVVLVRINSLETDTS